VVLLRLATNARLYCWSPSSVFVEEILLVAAYCAPLSESVYIRRFHAVNGLLLPKLLSSLVTINEERPLTDEWRW
jgi:hypothetical protein